MTTVSERLTVFSALVPALALLLPPVRRVIGRAWNWCRSFSKSRQNQQLILAKLSSIEIFVATNGDRLATIEKEMKFNGGRTIKDMLFLLFNYRRHDYWRIGHPVMEIDGQAQVTLVSESTCRLFGVSNPDDLKRRSWLNYLSDTRIEEMLRCFQDAVNFQSEFSWKFQVRAGGEKIQGEWEMRASPISDMNSANKIYSVNLIPVCDIAKRVAKELQIEGLISCDLCRWKGAEAVNPAS